MTVTTGDRMVVEFGLFLNGLQNVHPVSYRRMIKLSNRAFIDGRNRNLDTRSSIFLQFIRNPQKPVLTLFVRDGILHTGTVWSNLKDRIAFFLAQGGNSSE